MNKQLRLMRFLIALICTSAAFMMSTSNPDREVSPIVGAVSVLAVFLLIESGPVLRRRFLGWSE